MNQTPNYQLNQWDKTDRIRMEDFNADNAKIEAAIKGLEASTAQALAAAGNCKIATGSYVGKGNYGASNPNTLTFQFKPMFILLKTNTPDPSSSIPRNFILTRPSSEMGFNMNNMGSVSWSDTSVSWYNKNALEQLSESNVTYWYIAIGM